MAGKKQALGYSRTNAFKIPFEEVVLVGLDTEDGDEHPLYDERVHDAPDEVLVLSIMFVRGLIQPIVVRKNGPNVECVVGRRRVLAGREANRRFAERGEHSILATCIVARANDSELRGMMIAENEIRRNDDPVGKARKLERFLRGNSVDDAAIVFGVTKTTIGNWRKLLDTTELVQAAVSSGIISASAAQKLAKLPHDEQDAKLAKLTEKGGKPTIADVEEKVDGKPKPPGKKLLKKILSADAEHKKLHGQAFMLLEWILTGENVDSVTGLKGLIELLDASSEKP